MGASRDRNPLTFEIEAGPVGVGADPCRVAPAGEHPGQRRAVALRNAALGQHLRGAVGSGVAAVGAELDPSSGLIEMGAVPRAEAHEPLFGAAVPIDRQPQWGAVGHEHKLDPVAPEQPDRQPGMATPLEHDIERHPVRTLARRSRVERALGRTRVLVGDHALGELDELILNRSFGDPDAGRTQEREPSPPDRERERSHRDLHSELVALERDRVGLREDGDLARRHT